MERIVLKSESCIGCGACVGIDAEHFEFSDDGYSTVKSQENLDSPALADAIDACPVGIISVEEVGEEPHTEEEHSSETCSCEEECTCSCKLDDIADEAA